MNSLPPLTHHPITPSSHHRCPPLIGILGGGQLGRMLALAGIPLGLRFRFLERKADCPAAAVGEIIVGDYHYPAALARFADGLTVATYEFENVPAATARWLTDHVPVFPPEGVLATAQDRLAEKQLFRSLGIGTADFAPVDSPADWRDAGERIGYPHLLKSRRMGYDGRGQFKCLGRHQITDGISESIICRDAIVESLVPFTRELSIIAARARDGRTAFYPLTQNTHDGGILRESIAPAPDLTPDLQSRAESLAQRVLDHTQYVGVLAIELFQLADGSLLANEMAPRVHNSGHWTQDGAECSQFENHLRAIMGWPLGSTAARPSAMLNLLRGIPPMEDLGWIQGAHLHTYGKKPRGGGEGDDLRKIGHINLTAPTPSELLSRLSQARALMAQLNF